MSEQLNTNHSGTRIIRYAVYNFERDYVSLYSKDLNECEKYLESLGGETKSLKIIQFVSYDVEPIPIKM